MRGIPLLEILFIALLFGLAAVPLSHLTFRRVAQDTPRPPAEEIGLTGNFIIARFAHTPIAVSVSGQKMEPGDFEIDIAAPYGDDLDVFVEWAEGTPATAATFIVETDGRPTAEHTFWSSSDSTILKTRIPTL